MRKWIIAATAAVALTQMAAVSVTPSGDSFWIYKQDLCKFFIPSGYMGDYSDIRMNQRWDKNPASGKTCIQVFYSAKQKEGAGWAGVYFQNPANNWGNMRGGANMSAFSKLKFKARGETGKEWIEKFMVGGISGQGESSDSASADTGQVQLTKDWTEYTVDLSQQDRSEVIGAFGFVVSATSAPEGETFYLADVRFER